MYEKRNRDFFTSQNLFVFWKSSSQNIITCSVMSSFEKRRELLSAHSDEKDNNRTFSCFERLTTLHWYLFIFWRAWKVSFRVSSANRRSNFDAYVWQVLCQNKSETKSCWVLGFGKIVMRELGNSLEVFTFSLYSVILRIWWFWFDSSKILVFLKNCEFWCAVTYIF